MSPIAARGPALRTPNSPHKLRDLTHTPPPHREAILAALQYQMHRSLSDTNLGRWAELMQASIPFWPYSTLPSLRTVRRKAHTNAWFVHVPPPNFVIYVCINLRTGAVYVGQTGQSPDLAITQTPHRCTGSSGLCHIPQTAPHYKFVQLGHHSCAILRVSFPSRVG